MENEQRLKIVKTRNIFLKEGEISDKIVLVDNIGGDMYFTFCLKYIPDEEKGRTHFNIKDPFHVDVVVETKPNAHTKLENPYLLGTYEKDKDLLINIFVKPREANDAHDVTVVFYINK